MIFSDIYEDARQVLGYVEEAVVMSRVSDAVDVLNNKGNFDALLGYLITTPTGDIITLPPDVQVPLRVNIDDNPAFPRDKFWVFSQNGPGSNATLAQWNWVDKGPTPVTMQPASLTALAVVGNIADNGKTLKVVGRDSANILVGAIYTIGSAAPAQQFKSIERVHKEVTTQSVTLQTSAAVVLSIYATIETEPIYRQIRINKSGATAYVLFRRKNFRIAAQTEYIPIRSKMGLLYMIKALEAYRREQPDLGEQLEKMALKLATEEQGSNNAFVELSNQIDAPPCRGLSYARRDILTVADVYDDACAIFGPIGYRKIFDRITETFQALANKGNMDSMMSYLRISSPKTLITLPLMVEAPLKVAIDGNPAFARGRFYEFTMNGPGPDAERVGWQWEDKGPVPVINQPSVPSALQIIGNVSDNGAQIMITGADSAGAQISQTLTLGTQQIGTKTFAFIDSVRKPETLDRVELLTADGSEIMAIYDTFETIPQYRQIRLSKASNNVYILYRQKSPTVTSIDDILPLRSKMAFLLMMKAAKAYRDGDVKAAKEMETEAAEKVRDEQSSYNAFAELADDGGALNLSYNNIDSIIVADIYDEACRIFGQIGRDNIYDKITEAKSILGRKCQWDSLRGYVDINTDQYKYVTLPRYVEYPIAISINNRGGRMENKWFAFHLDAPNSCWTTLRRNSWRELGEFVTLRDVPYSIKLSAVPDVPDVDDGKEIIVYGYFRGKRLQRQDQNGLNIDGIAIPISSTTSTYSETNFDRIERISKPITNGFVKLLASDTTLQRKFTLGYYYPDETEPRYRRIELPRGCEVIRMMYRLRENKVSSLTDPIHLRSKMAIVCMMQAMKMLTDGDVKNAEDMEQKAVRYLMDEQAINNQSDGLTIDADPSFRLARRFLPA